MKNILLSLLTILFTISTNAIEIKKTTIELLQNPLALESAEPRFGWQLTSDKAGDYQSAYQIVVSTTDDFKNIIWDSGRIKSDKSQFVKYEGQTLTKNKNYYYRIRVWGASEKVSAWSNTGSWRTAPNIENSGAQWIGAITKTDAKLPDGRDFHDPTVRKDSVKKLWEVVEPLGKQSIILRRDFMIEKKIAEVYVNICGLGHYEMTINGKRVGDGEFAPLWSDYDKTLYYNTYRVDTLINSGKNTFGVLLGNGMYNVVSGDDRYRKFRGSFGAPTLFFVADIIYTDGSSEKIVSDKSWRWDKSPITFNCVFGGEDYDARLEQNGWDMPLFNDQNWKEVVVQPAPKGKLTPQLAPEVKTMQRYNIKEVTQPNANTLVFNMGQNLSGVPTIKVKGKRGDTIKMIVGESITSDGLADQKRTGGPHYYLYTLSGNGIETWQPKFSYYGYQYIMVENANYKGFKTGDEFPEIIDITSNFIYNSAPEIGTFESSNEIFNKSHWLINNAIKSNMQAVFTDCPHREKLGWIEEVHLNGPGLFYNYDVSQLMAKVFRDMSDAQHPSGLVPSITPEYVNFGADSWGNPFQDSPEWGAAIVIAPWQYYEYYGDPSLIEKYYTAMKRYVDYLETKSDGFILSHGLGDWYDYGDHPAGMSKNSPIAISATSHWYYVAKTVEKSAKMLKRSDDEVKYATLAEKIQKAYNQKFFNTQTKQYATGSQFSNAVSIYMGLVEPQYRDDVMKNLLDDIEKHGDRLTTGDIGNRYLYMTLAENGHNNVMYKMHNHYDAPGYGYQIKFGLSTLTEQWDPKKGSSWNHFMMGQIEEWFFGYLAGIRADMNAPGFKNVILDPQIVGDMTFVKASHTTLYGEIKVEWNRNRNVVIYDVTIPVNCTGTFIIPVGGKNITLDGKAYNGETIVSGNHKIEWEI